MTTLRAVRRFELRPLDDPNRALAEIEIVADADLPSLGEVAVSATMQLWIGDNPTYQQLQLRALHTLAEALPRPDELRSELGSVYASDQIRVAANQ
jgi:hypothetical protein